VSIKTALRSVVLALIAITGISAYGFVVAFKWLEAHQVRLDVLETNAQAERRNRMARSA
jgi:hypothetical protein